MTKNSFGRIKVCGGYVISGFRREEAEDCALLCCYSPSGGNLLSSFRDKLSVPSAGSKKLKRKSETQILRTVATDGREWAVEILRSLVSATACWVRTQKNTVHVCDGYFEVDLEKLLEGWD